MTQLADARVCLCVRDSCHVCVGRTERGRVRESSSVCDRLLCCAAQGLTIDDKSAAKLKATADELVEEKQLALECIGEAH